MKLLLSVVGLLLLCVLPALCWLPNAQRIEDRPQPRLGVKQWDDVLKEMQEKKNRENQEPRYSQQPFAAQERLEEASQNPQAPLFAESSPSRIPGEYIVVFKDTVTDEQISSHMQALTNLINSYGTKANGIKSNFQIGKFQGYSAHMDDNVRDHIRTMQEVKYVEYNQMVHTQVSCLNQAGATWGLVRTTFRDLPSTTDYTYMDGAGEDVDVYIIDTGIEISHPDFGGRAIWGADFVANPSPQTDQNGHGTHVAGTVMSNTWGVAKKATAIAVRVLDANGGGTLSGVIDGIEYVVDEHKASGRKSVANLSLGGGRSTSLNDAVDAAVDAGVHVAVAAGNEAQDACNVSPASAPKVVTVGASDINDVFASFSNYGDCVDIIAPGVAITSTWLNGGTLTISGTSMATPHVAGVMAKFLSSMACDPSPDQLASIVYSYATPDKIGSIPTSTTPNLLLFRDCH